MSFVTFFFHCCRYARALQDYVSLFQKDNVVQFDVRVWDDGAHSHICPDPHRLRAYYVFPDKNKGEPEKL